MFERQAKVRLRDGTIITVDVYANGCDCYYLSGARKVFVRLIIGCVVPWGFEEL